MAENTKPCIVFLVQTESSVRDFVDRVLHGHGALVFSASTAAGALRFVKNYRDDIHLVIVDRHMAGADGLELAVQIALERPAARVVLMCETNGDGLPEEWKERLLRAPVQCRPRLCVARWSVLSPLRRAKARGSPFSGLRRSREPGYSGVTTG